MANGGGASAALSLACAIPFYHAPIPFYHDPIPFFCPHCFALTMNWKLVMLALTLE